MDLLVSSSRCFVCFMGDHHNRERKDLRENLCLRLVLATLIRAADTWQSIGTTATEKAQLHFLCQKLKIKPAPE